MRWRLSIDTGGTFTDCLATPSHGPAVRVKVLSSSIVRARVESGPVDRAIITRWSIPDRVLEGCPLALSGQSPATSHAEPTVIESHTTRDGMTTIRLAGPVPPGLRAGAVIEVAAPWAPPILAARVATATPAGSDLPPIDMRLATTRGTNALLERRGSPPALFITRGFGDLLDIGDQSRPDLFALDIVKPAPLHAGSYEIDERLAVDGVVLRPLNTDQVREQARAARHAGHTVAAVALIHSWINPAHERAVEAILREEGFEHVSASAALSPLLGLLARTQSAVVDAYLSRAVGEYLADVERGLGPHGRLLVMTSAGGLVRAADYRPKDSLLSGPAGGLLGAADAAASAGRDPRRKPATPAETPGMFERVLTFDMGGTSTDVARIDSASRREFPLTREHRVADARILAPAVGVESVAAGGGSICWFERGEMGVGPESAGASPGPACYGAGGPLTITDCHVLLGRITPERFAIPIDAEAARRAAVIILNRVNADAAARPPTPAGESREPTTLEALLEGFLDLADERMGDAVRRISIRHGHDPADFALLAFGGAGGLHACSLARRLGMSRVIVPPDAGLLSARGLDVARLERTAVAQTLCTLGDDPTWIAPALQALEARATGLLRAEGVEAGDLRIIRRQLTCRVLGQSASFDLAGDDPHRVPELFAAQYERTFGQAPPDRPIEVESMLVMAAGPSHAGESGASDHAVPADAPVDRPHRLYAAGQWQQARRLAREALAGQAEGPLLITDAHATTYVPPGWTAARAASGALVLEMIPAATPAGGAQPLAAPDDPGAPAPSTCSSAHVPRHSLPAAPPGSLNSPIALELFIASLTSIAQDMGEMLRRTALSVNVKERLDFSCAILSADGRLLVNAPHIPVHLGALGLCVRALAGAIEMLPGDTIITNHPAFGGSHLPDVTLVTPIFAPTAAGPRLIAYAASRAHHAEIGGIKPGSMPPGATRLVQEGVVIPPMHLVRAGRDGFDALAQRLSAPPFPTRAIEHNLADVRAALAANLHGSRALVDLFGRTGLERSAALCESLTTRARERVRAALREISPGTYSRADRLDDGSPIAVTIKVPTDPDARVVIDFAGSAPIHPRNFNATPAIATAATLYVLRLLAREPIPLNEGMLEAIDLRLPEGTIVNPGQAWSAADGPAVAAGNVETSQRIVDVLLLALGLSAASQGTMNNLAFGNDQFGFYETIGGGAGATPSAPGASAVHTHMTNTRITDVEVLESRLPVRVAAFRIRFGTGGAGHHRGGDGIIRAFEFLSPVVCSLLAQRRQTAPPGLAGGACGRAGVQVTRRPMHEIMCESRAETSELVQAGTVLQIETPGGGGWGNPQK